MPSGKRWPPGNRTRQMSLTKKDAYVCLKGTVDMVTHLGRAAKGKLALGDAEVD